MSYKMRYKILTAIIFIFIAGCIDPDTPNQDNGVMADAVTDSVAPGDAVLDAQTDKTSDSGQELSSPVMTVNAPDDSVYFAMKSVKGRTLTVEVRAKGIRAVALLSFRVKFDSTVLALMKTETAALFGQADKKGVFMSKDMGDGTISFGGAYFGLRKSVDFKDDLIATLTFNILKPVAVDLSLPAGYVLVLDRHRHPITVNFLNSNLNFISK